MIDIDLKYKIPLIGKYNRRVIKCPHCDYDMMSKMFQNTRGFADAYIGQVQIVECSKCFEPYYHHVNETNYEVFLEIVAAGENKFFNT